MSLALPDNVHVTKLSAARRQLCAAIRMFLSGEDDLAIHTVASAAYNILNDLKLHRGRHEVADLFHAATFYVVRDYHRGALPSEFTEDPATMEWISKLAKQLPITENSQYDEMSVSVSPDVVKSYWKHTRKASNFLKHADRDPRSSISKGQVDNEYLLMASMASYMHLVPFDFPVEFTVLWLLDSVNRKSTEDLPEKFQGAASSLDSLSLPERKAFCSSVLQELREETEE